MRRAWIVPCALVGAFAAGACELFFPFDTQVDGSVDSSMDASSADGGADATDAIVDAPPPFDGTLPSTLYSFTGKGVSLAADGTSLYWFLIPNKQQPNLMITNKQDGGTTVLFADAGPNANAIVLDDARVYWVTFAAFGAPNGGSVVSVAKDGGDFAVLAYKSDWWPDHLAVDDSSLYVLNPTPSTEPLVVRVSKDGGALVALESTGASNPNPESIAVDDASVYRVHQSVIASYPKDCSLEAGTCAVKVLMVENTNNYCVRDIAVDDTGLYWVQSQGTAPCVYGCGTYRTSKNGGVVLDAAVNLYPSGSSCGKFLSLDSKSAYTISYALLEILAAAKGGGGSVLTPPQINPQNAPVVPDGVAIYWIDDYNTGNGRIMKLPR